MLHISTSPDCASALHVPGKTEKTEIAFFNSKVVSCCFANRHKTKHIAIISPGHR